MADPVSPFSPNMSSEIEQLLQSQIDRSNSQTPIHQAAMAMAQHMAPSYAQGAMGAPGGAMPTSPLGLSSPSGAGSSAPGLGSTVSLTAMAALLKNPEFMAAIKKLLGGATPGAIPPGAPGAPATTAKPSGFTPVAGAPGSAGGMNGTFPGYFTNPDGSTVEVPGDPANGGGYSGGFFHFPEDPRHD